VKQDTTDPIQPCVAALGDLDEVVDEDVRVRQGTSLSFPGELARVETAVRDEWRCLESQVSLPSSCQGGEVRASCRTCLHTCGLRSLPQNAVALPPRKTFTTRSVNR
jgi:hypothetical protein